MTTTLEILYEDNHCLAIAKPSGLVSAHFQGEEATADRLVKSYLKEKHNKPGNVFLGVVQRLDKPVSGVLLFARTSKAAARLSEQFREGTVDKVYWAIVEGRVVQAEGTLEDWLAKDEEEDPCRDRRSENAACSSGRYCSIDGWDSKANTPGSNCGPRLADGTSFAFSQRIYATQSSGMRNTARRKISARPLPCTPGNSTFLHPISREPIVLTAKLPQGWMRQFGKLIGETTA